MEHIQFSQNWNGKLFLDNFGTIRLHRPDNYYIGAEKKIMLNSIDYGVADIVSVRPFLFGKITDGMAWLDCGRPLSYLQQLLTRMYKNEVPGGITANTTFCHVVLHYTERNLEVQADQMALWWRELHAKQINKRQLQHLSK